MVETYQLFQYQSCPFCYRVRQFLDASGIEIELRDTQMETAARVELIEGGGRQSVPCLRIQCGDGVQWLYESLDIIKFLRKRFGV